MKIEKLTPNKIKITLFEDDLLKWDINMQNLKPDSDELKDIFWSIIRNVQTETDFYTDGAQLMVEAVKRPDSFVMIVTKTDKKAKTFSFKKPASISKVNVFCFEDFNDVVAACNAAKDRIAVKSSLYKYNGTYYLVLQSESDYVSKLTKILFSEYGSLVEDSTSAADTVAEHGEVMFKDNALETAAKI